MASEDRVWERGWEGHERAQRRRLAALPLTEKLRWLEESQELVLHLRKRAAAVSGSQGVSGEPGTEPEPDPSGGV